MIIVYTFKVSLGLGENFEVEGKLGIGSEATVILSKNCFLFWEVAFCVLYFKGPVYNNLKITLRS